MDRPGFGNYKIFYSHELTNQFCNDCVGILTKTKLNSWFQSLLSANYNTAEFSGDTVEFCDGAGFFSSPSSTEADSPSCHFKIKVAVEAARL